MDIAHDFSAEQLPIEQVHLRQERCRQYLDKYMDNVGGLLVFSRTNIYYLTGTRANGLLWLPRQGDPVLLVRKGEERCRLESPLKNIVSFKSYSHIAKICEDLGSPFSACIGAEMSALPWSLASMLESRLKEYEFVDISQVLAKVRFVKTPYELEKLRTSCQLQYQALTQDVPKLIKPQMTEQEIARALWKIYFSQGHGGMLRPDVYNTETFLGHVATGSNSLYPSAYEDITSTVGVHPSMPFMGSPNSLWSENQNLMLDTGFIYEGYHSHLALTYFSGAESSIPPIMQKTYDNCLETLDKCIQSINANLNVHDFLMSMKSNQFKSKDDIYKISIHGLGLSLQEYPNFLPALNEENLCQNNAVLKIGVMGTLPTTSCVGGVVGIRTVVQIVENKAVCLNEVFQKIICI